MQPTCTPMSRHLWTALASAVTILAATAQLSARADGLPAVQRQPMAVFMLHPGGELRLDLLKRDLNIYEGEDYLEYRLVAPGWQILKEGRVGDDGNAAKGPRAEKVHRETLNMPGAEPGLYTLQLRPVNNDMLFGFETDCKHYVMQGDCTFSDTDQNGIVYFPAPPQWAKLELGAIHQFPFEITLRDGKGHTLQAFQMPSRDEKDATYEVPRDRRGEKGLWSIEATSFDYNVKFHGQDMGYWTTKPDAWFDAAQMRWMLYPKRRKVYIEAGHAATMQITLRNDAPQAQEFQLAIDTPRHLEVEMLEPKSTVRLEGNGAETPVRFRIAAPADMVAGAIDYATLRATRTDAPHMTERCDITVRVGTSPVGNPLDLPITLKFYEHENAQFGYLPGYTPNAVFFDLKNRPFIRQRIAPRDFGGAKAVHVFDGVKWTDRSLLEAIRQLYPDYKDTLYANGWLPTKIVFDKDGDAYTYLKIALDDGRMRCALLHGIDGFRDVRAYDLPVAAPDRQGGGWSLWGTTQVEIEQFTGHNLLDGPPPILLFHKTANHPAPWASVYDMKILTAHKIAGRLEFDEPILVTSNSGGTSQHSGGAASTATRGDKTHIVWWELSKDDAPGAPTYVCTLDRKTRQLSKPVLIGYGAPPNDCHNQPGILVDSTGVIHALTGAHGRTFMYATSLKPNDASAFTDAIPVPSRGLFRDEKTHHRGQTYLSMLCDSKDNLHISYRLHRLHADGYKDGWWTCNLAYQRKPKSKDWEMPRLMVRPPLIGYSNYHAKLTIDRRDRLFLSYCYLCHDSYYSTIMPGWYHHTAVMMSDDGGDAWRLVRNEDFAQGIR